MPSLLQLKKVELATQEAVWTTHEAIMSECAKLCKTQAQCDTICYKISV